MRISPFRPLDPFVATVAAATGYACVSLLGDRSGAVLVELVVLAAAATLAYVQRRVGPLRIAVAGGAAYVVVELARGRLGFDHYWEHVTALVLLGATVAAAAATRVERDELRAVARRADEELRDLRAVDELDRLLGVVSDPVERELLRSRRHDHAAGVLLVRPDADDDEALRAVASALGRLLRTSDVAFRQGARDVCVLLPETDPAGARAAGERLRLALLGAGAPTVSIGAASFPETEFRDGLLVRAGEALERARALGGNRTVASFLPPTTPSAWRLADEPAVTRTSD